MNGLDLILLTLALIAAMAGWRLGFLRRLSGWVGTAIGLMTGILLAPTVVGWFRLDSDLGVLLVGTALLVLLASIGQGIGAVIGSRLRRGVDTDHGRHLDAFGGSALGVVAVVVLAWLVVPIMADTEGWPSASARGSVIAAGVDEWLPDPPAQIRELERQLTQGGAPRLFRELRRAPEIPDPPGESTVSPELLSLVAQSSVRVQGEACGRRQSGSGFVVAPGVVATNAHVVAGTAGVSLTTADGQDASGQVVAFDPSTDLALVATELDRPPLEVGSPSLGDRGLVLGFPGGGPFAPSAFEVGDAFSATGYDIYDGALVDRRLLALASQLAPGDSGSAVLRGDGRVIGVAVAVAPDRPSVAYALDAVALIPLLDGGTGARVSTGECLR